MSETVSETQAPPQGNLGAILSVGRSGSTWLGSIVNSHPDVAYRFEPFLRRRAHACIREAVKLIESESFSDADLPKIYEGLLPAHPLTDKSPFFQKSHSRSAGKSLLWPVCRGIGVLGGAYGRLYSPQGKPFLIFKEVSRRMLMQRLQDRTALRAVYLVRHPCAVVASMLRGQSADLMPSGRLDALGDLLADYDPELADKVGAVDGLSPAAKNALLWRLDVEQGVRTARERDDGKVVLYENLCREPAKVAREVLAFFGLAWHANVERYVPASGGESSSVEESVNSDTSNSYFSVAKDTKETMNRWKSQLSAEEIGDILRHVEDSETFQYCAELGGWE